MIELILAEDIIGIAKTGDTVVLKDDNTFEIQKAKTHDTVGRESGNFPPTEQEEKDVKTYADKLKEKKESLSKVYDPRIEKYLPNDKVKAWAILEKFNASNTYFDANEVLKEFINKVATCPDVTDKFEKVMEGWMRDGEADISAIEKIIASCKKEGGNVVVEGDDKLVKSEHTCSICDVEKGAARKLQMLGYERRLEERNNSKAEADKKEEDSEDVEKAERTPEQLKEMEAARRRQQADDEDTKIKPIGKSEQPIGAKQDPRQKQLEAARKKPKDDEDTKIKPIGKSAEIIEAITKWERPEYLDETDRKKRKEEMEEHRNKNRETEKCARKK